MLNSLKKLPAFQALFVLFCLFMLMLPLNANGASSKPLSQAPLDIQEAYRHISDDFNLYQQFLQVEQTAQGPVLINARNPGEACRFLAPGFGKDLSNAIWSSCTWYDQERERLVLIPGDGIPLLGKQEQGAVVYCQESDEILHFQYRFENAYRTGNAYLYEVEAQFTGGHWKIQALQLSEMTFISGRI